MIRRLIYCVLIALSTGAWLSESLLIGSGSVSPPPLSTIVCDIGPPYTGAVPAAAIQAGFTHCGANYDFTYTAAFTDIRGTHTWSTLSTWLANNAQTDGSWLLYYQPYVQGVGFSTTYQNIINDGGTQVLTQFYTLVDAQNSRYNNMLWSSNFVGPPPGLIGITFPQAYYMENVFKSNTANVCTTTAGSGCEVSEIGVAMADQQQFTNPCFVNEDYESSGPLSVRPNSGALFDLWNQVCGTASNAGGQHGPTTLPPSPNGSTYGTYGYLVTTDGTNTYALCAYYNSLVKYGLSASDFLSCGAAFTVIPPTTSTIIFSRRNNLNIWEGPQSAGQGGNAWLATNHTLYTQRITFWVCPSPTGGPWQTTGQCYNSPVITTHP